MPKLYHFEVLPMHPRPEDLESLTSWLMRLSNSNLIDSANALHTCVNANLQYQRKKPDTYPANLTSLSRATACPPEQILETTFHYLGLKFRRTQRVSVLTKTEVSNHLRYCPECLFENGYNSLLWRFSRLVGCPTHEVFLLEACPTCHRKIPLYAAPYRVGICSHCGEDLTRGNAKPIESDLELKSLSYWSAEIRFLLTPVKWDVDDVSNLLGPHLAAKRRQLGISPEDMCELTDMSRENIKALENSDTGNFRGLRLHHYIRYLEVIGTTFRGVFSNLLDELNKFPERKNWSQKDFYEQKLLDQLIEAKAKLESNGIEVNQKLLASHVRMDVPTLRYYPRIQAFLEEIASEERVQERRKQREEELLRQVKQAIHQLESTNLPITQQAIGDLIGRAPEGFKLYPEVVDCIAMFTISREERFTKREAELIECVNTAVAHLEGVGKLVSQAEVANRIGISREGLMLYPRVAKMMEKIAENYRTYIENRPTEIITHLRESEQRLLQLQCIITKQALAEEIGMATVSLNHYPEVSEEVRQICNRHRSRNQKLQQQKREQEIIEEIHNAVKTLKARNDQITRQSLVDQLSISKRTLSRYVTARNLVSEIIEQHR